MPLSFATLVGNRGLFGVGDCNREETLVQRAL